MDSPHLDRVLRLKTNSVRGGTLENIHLRNIEVGQVSEAIVAIDFTYEEGDTGKFAPAVRNISVQNLTSKKSKYALYLRGYERAPVTDIKLTDCILENVAKPNVTDHVQGLSLKNVRINGQIAN